MSNKKIIAVFGATGAQGGGLVRAILNDPTSEFSVRAITRDVNSDKAKALAKMGAEVVAADVDDAASLNNALKGAYGAFLITFFWEHFSPEKELQHAHSMADAAKANNLQHIVWSTLEDTRRFIPLHDDRMPTLKEKYKVPHFDAKGEADEYFKKLGLPVTYLLAAFYWENLIYFGAGPKRGEDGKLSITFPLGDAKMAGIGSEDIGKCAFGIFKKGKELIGEAVGVAGEHLTINEMAKKLSKALGENVSYNSVSPDVYRSFGFPGADDLGNMFQFYADFEEYFEGGRDVKLSKQLNPTLQSFDQWLATNVSKIPLS
jgi:uncharacterized protein YbjT (DUF2867 family)